jgi:hypothetical protein
MRQQTRLSPNGRLFTSPGKPLKKISPATIDRYLKKDRDALKLKGKSLTKPLLSLKSRIPIRAFSSKEERKGNVLNLLYQAYPPKNQTFIVRVTTILCVCSVFEKRMPFLTNRAFQVLRDRRFLSIFCLCFLVTVKTSDEKHS